MNKIFSFIKTRLDQIITTLLFIGIFISLLYPYADPDWGWHYQYGRLLLQTGHFMRSDIFSWTLPSYQWVNHEWLFDPIIYLVFNYTGYIGAMLGGTIATFFCFWLLIRKYKLSYWKITIAAICFVQIGEIVIRNGLRSQVLALVPLSVLIYILRDATENFRRLWFIPFIMLAWANIHGTFVYGLLIISIFFTIWIIKYHKVRLLIIGVFITSLAATLINPFGINVYIEIFRHLTSPILNNISEWLPITNNCSNCHPEFFTIYSIFLLLVFIDFHNIKNLPFFLLGLVFIIPTIEYRRNLPVYAIVTLPLLLSYLESLKFDLSKYKVTSFIFIIGIITFIEYNLFTRLPSFNFYNYSDTDYCANGPLCSLALTNYLKINPPSGKGINYYGWGGFFIGKQLPVKLFVDGRMHLWKTGNGYSPFTDYMNIYYNASDINLFNKYGFDWVISEPNSILAQDILAGKVSGNWVIKYQDNLSVYFAREKESQ